MRAIELGGDPPRALLEGTQDEVRALAPLLGEDLPVTAGPPSTVRAYVLAQRGLDHVTVADDRELLRQALLALRPAPFEGPQARWSLVRCALGHGSGVGFAICRALGIGPDEQVAPDPLPEWVTEALDLDSDKEADRG